jgi:hypothetical protein
MSDSRSARGPVAAASDRLAGMFARVGGDRDAFTGQEVRAMWPKVMASLRSVREPGVGSGDADEAAGTAGEAGERTSRWAPQMVSVARMRDIARSIAPRLPIRDRPTLARHLHTDDSERMADLLVRNASGATAVAGTVGGVFVLPARSGPALIAAIPIRVAAETLVVAMIELKLIGELHEVYGLPLAGTPAQRGTTALKLWASHRGLHITDAGGLVATLSQMARTPTTRRAAAAMSGKAMGRKGLRLGAGVAGAVDNRRSTVMLGDRVRAELRRHQIGTL